MKNKLSKDELRKYLEEMFKGKSMIFRRDPDLNRFIAPGSLANRDSEGRGIDGATKIGNKTFYPRSSTIDLLVEISDAI